MKTTRTIGRTIKTLLAAAALAVPVLAMPKPAAALEYVNLLDQPAPRPGNGVSQPQVDNGPVSQSWGSRDATAEPLPEPMPEGYVTPEVAAFNRIFDAALASRQQAEAAITAQANAYDQAIAQQQSAKQVAEQQWNATKSVDAALRYWDAELRICSFQIGKSQMLAGFFNDNIFTFNDMRARDPQAQQHSAWFEDAIGKNRTNLNQMNVNVPFYTNAYSTAVQNYNYNYGLRSAGYR